MWLGRDLSWDRILCWYDELPRNLDLSQRGNMCRTQHVHGLGDLRRCGNLSSQSDMRWRRSVLLRAGNVHRLGYLPRFGNLQHDLLHRRRHLQRAGDLPRSDMPRHGHLSVDDVSWVADLQTKLDLPWIRDVHRHADMPRCVDVPGVRNLPWDADLLRNDDMQQPWFPDMCCGANLHGIQHLLRHVHL
jgi:hypothetical protein